MTDTCAAETVSDQEFSYRPLIWLAVATFSMGIDGYVLTGLLPAIAADLHVSVAAAGQLMSAFALTAAFAGPVLGTVTSRWERRTTIATALAVFVLGNLVVGLATTYPIAFAGRVLAALGGCLLNAAVSGYVIAVTPVRHRGKALSFVLGGLLTATALGVPVGLVIGQSSWRYPMILVAVMGTIALAGILRGLPRRQLPAGRLTDQLRPLGRPRLLGSLLVTTGILTGSFTCFTYAVLILGPSFPRRLDDHRDHVRVRRRQCAGQRDHGPAGGPLPGTARTDRRPGRAAAELGTRHGRPDAHLCHRARSRSG